MQIKTNSLLNRKTAYSLTSKTMRHVKPILNSSFQQFKTGFHPFGQIPSSNLNSTMKESFFESTTETKDLSMSPVSIMLSQNKNKLGIILKKIYSKRQQQYQNYMNSNVKYSKLLELNNNKSKVMTSLKSNVGQVIIKVIDEHKPEDYQYVAQFDRISPIGWKPESRQGQLCIVYKDNLYLFGGHNSDPIGDVCLYNFKQETWSKIPNNQVKRSYHTGVVYKQNYFVIFGGMSKYNSYYKTRECLNSLCLFSPLANGIKHIKIDNENIVEPRRSHSACIIGKQMIILGGINMYREYLKDLKYLDFRQLKWVELEYKIQSSELQQFLDHGIAKHVMVANFHHRPGHYKLYNKDYESGQGIFIFGGTNQVGMRSIILHVSFKKRVPKFQKLYPSGYLPSGVFPIVSKVNENIIAIISGERSQREMKLYRIKENQFVSVHYNSSSLGGIGSSIVNYKDEMYILFGVGQNGYISNISNFKLEQKLKSQLQKQARRQRRHSFVQKDFRINPSFFKNNQQV